MKHVRLVLAATAFAVSTPLLPAQSPTYDDVQWGTVPTTGNDKKLLFDIYLPPDLPGVVPVVLFIHGGGWANGSQNDVYPIFSQLLARGVAVASTNYRYSSEAVFPAQIHDVKGAVRWLRANGSAYKLDTCRIAAWGCSAGGFLASLLGTTSGSSAFEGTSGGNPSMSSSVRAVITYFAPSDLLELQPDFFGPPPPPYVGYDAPGSAVANLLGFPAILGVGAVRADPVTYATEFMQLQQASPVTQASSATIPFFIGHSIGDLTVPVMQSQRLYTALPSGSAVYSTTAGNLHHGSLGSTIDARAALFAATHLAGTCL